MTCIIINELKFKSRCISRQTYMGFEDVVVTLSNSNRPFIQNLGYMGLSNIALTRSTVTDLVN